MTDEDSIRNGLEALEENSNAHFEKAAPYILRDIKAIVDQYTGELALGETKEEIKNKLWYIFNRYLVMNDFRDNK